MDKRGEAEFAKADRAVDKTAAAITAQIHKLLDQPYKAVARDYLVERLLLALVSDHDLAAIIGHMAMPGPATLKLSNGLWTIGTRSLSTVDERRLHRLKA
jgi:hypothetical protein